MDRHMSCMPPMYTTSPTPTPEGSAVNSTMSAMMIPANAISIWMTSVQITAVMPPISVYATVTAAMIRIVTVSSQPRMTESTIAGAYMMMPAPIAPLSEEQKRSEAPGLGIEAPLQVLVGGEDLGAVEERHEEDA